MGWTIGSILNYARIWMEGPNRSGMLIEYEAVAVLLQWVIYTEIVFPCCVVHVLARPLMPSCITKCRLNARVLSPSSL